MKVLLINGSPKENGNTFMALNEVAGELNKEGIETEIISIGKKEGKTLDPCRVDGAKLKELGLLAIKADDAVLAYLERHDYDGNLSQNNETLVLYLGGMEFEVESLFVDGNCNPAAFGTCYEMEADIRINRLGSEDNLRKIIKYCENN